jgi:hypothetical protein
MISRKIYEMFNTQSQVTEHLDPTSTGDTGNFSVSNDTEQTTVPTITQKQDILTTQDLIDILTNTQYDKTKKYHILTQYNLENSIIPPQTLTEGNDNEIAVQLFFIRKIIAELEILYMFKQWDISDVITSANLKTLNLIKGSRIDNVTYETHVSLFAANGQEMRNLHHTKPDEYGNSPSTIENQLYAIYAYIDGHKDPILSDFKNYLVGTPTYLNTYPPHISSLMEKITNNIHGDKSPSLFLLSRKSRQVALENNKRTNAMPKKEDLIDALKVSSQSWANLKVILTGDQNKFKASSTVSPASTVSNAGPTTTVPTTTVPTTTATVARNEAVIPAFLPLTKTTLIIDSRYRDNYHTTFSNNSTFTLNGDGLSNVVELKLTSVHIKNNSYNINMNNNLLRMNIQVQDVKRATDNIQNIIIPKGNYYQNKNDPETNLDLQIKELFNLYEEFKNVAVYFNYKNNKYYFYQTYAYLLTENSHMYNILFNFGTTISSRFTGDNYKQGRPPEGAEKTNRLFTNTGDGGFTKIEQSSDLNGNSLFNTIKKYKKFANFSIGQYLGFYPNNYSTHISNNVSVNYFQDDTIQDSSKKNYNILQFNIKNSETLFQKIYNLIILAKEDMFIGFVLNNLLDNNNCKHAILKLEPGFCSNIITHRSTSTSTDIVGTPPPAGAPGDAADSITYTIEIYLKNKLHQFPKFNNLIEPQNVTLNSTVNVFSDIIILPVISDKPYELNNDNYMLMNLKLGGSDIINIDSTSHAPSSVLNSFTQFRTEIGNDYFVNTGAISIKQFPSGKTLTTLTVTLYDKNDALFDLNNTDYSFLLECTEVAPQSGAYVKHLVGKQ